MEPARRNSDCNCLAVRQAARHITQLYDQCLAPFGLRTSQYAVLSALRRNGPTTINSIAAEMVMDRTTMGRNVQPLERDGLVEIRVAERDRRSRELHLTKKGRDLLTRSFAGWAKAQSSFDEIFGADRAAELRRLMRAVVGTEFAADSTHSAQ
jgi:DNA-binding MarR family transcriptional regulator